MTALLSSSNVRYFITPADPKRPVVVPGAANADVVVVTAPYPPPKPVVAGLLKADAPKPDGAVVLEWTESSFMQSYYLL